MILSADLGSGVLKCSGEPQINEDDNFGGEVPFNPSWRTGKWTVEEEVYAAKLIEFFTTGQLILQPGDGKTLRSFLAKKLNCNPMRISKKFACLEGMGVRYQQVEYSRDRIFANQQILDDYEKSYRIKDVSVQSRRIKRRQYRQKSEEKAKRRTEESLQNESAQNDSTTEDENEDDYNERNSNCDSNHEKPTHSESENNKTESIDYYPSASLSSKTDPCSVSGDESPAKERHRSSKSSDSKKSSSKVSLSSGNDRGSPTSSKSPSKPVKVRVRGSAAQAPLFIPMESSYASYNPLRSQLEKSSDMSSQGPFHPSFRGGVSVPGAGGLRSYFGDNHFNPYYPVPSSIYHHPAACSPYNYPANPYHHPARPHVDFPFPEYFQRLPYANFYSPGSQLPSMPADPYSMQPYPHNQNKIMQKYNSYDALFAANAALRQQDAMTSTSGNAIRSSKREHHRVGSDSDKNSSIVPNKKRKEVVEEGLDLDLHDDSTAAGALLLLQAATVIEDREAGQAAAALKHEMAQADQSAQSSSKTEGEGQSESPTTISPL